MSNQTWYNSKPLYTGNSAACDGVHWNMFDTDKRLHIGRTCWRNNCNSLFKDNHATSIDKYTNHTDNCRSAEQLKSAGNNIFGRNRQSRITFRGRAALEAKWRKTFFHAEFHKKCSHGGSQILRLKINLISDGAVPWTPLINAPQTHSHNDQMDTTTPFH